jgi:hypothetical protein
MVARRIFARFEGKEREGVAATFKDLSRDGRLGVGLVAEAEGEGEEASERWEEEVEEERVDGSSGFEVVEVDRGRDGSFDEAQTVVIVVGRELKAFKACT